MSEPTTPALPLVPAADAPSPTSAQALMNVLGKDTTPFFCSFDLTTPDGRKKLLKCDEPFDHEVRNHVKATIDVEHIFATPTEMPGDKEGEIKTLLKIVLMTPEGVTYGCFSEGIRGTISLLVGAYGMPPWRPPLKCEVYGIKGNHPSPLLKMRVIEEPTPKGKGAK